jgi:hypothetical protein
MTLELSKDGRQAMTLPAQGYWPDFSAQTEYPLTRFHLEPGQTWVHTVHFYEEFMREQERRFAEFRNAIRQDISEQLQQERAKGLKPEARADLFVAKDANVQKAIRFFQEHFRYEVGEYILTIRVRCSPASAFSPSTYRLTLFESDIDTLKRQQERFTHGEGIYYHEEKERTISVRLQPE